METVLSTFLSVITAAGADKALLICKGIKGAEEISTFIGQVPQWINYNQNLEEYLQILKRKMESLASVQADVVTELQNTEHQSGRKRKSEVNHWMRSVRGKFEDVKNVEDGFNRVRYVPRFLFRAWLGSCIEKEIQQVKDLIQQGSFPTGLLLNAPQGCGELLVTNMLKGVVVSQKLDEIWEHLVNATTIRIGVVGPEGIGKSAIMAQVYNQLNPSCNQYHVYYVNVPRNFSIYRLQDCIAEEIGVKLIQSEGSEIKRAAKIFNVLKKKKVFVLILDGLSQYFALEEVGIPMEGNEGKLIVTSRDLDICRKMSCQKTVMLEPLSAEDAKNLFMEKLAANAPLSEEIEVVASNIIQQCNGIPLRIIDMAVQLRGVSDVNEWRCTLSEM
ncbi:probable disease resistance protein At4g14610 [Beta vulgaris subsp. vulgaris]|uniref:probable disease resistance protein At4g14610 n=1 Tax=Beta vulgaris subsp. vulgaris TaxID=3555 RepID=UPI002036779D|nr:probable disease resistance protein At4g14610 [Beta vulgaris subsp. vulgaris]